MSHTRREASAIKSILAMERELKDKLGVETLDEQIPEELDNDDLFLDDDEFLEEENEGDDTASDEVAPNADEEDEITSADDDVDTDGDGFTDKEEEEAGTDPLDPTDYPGSDKEADEDDDPELDLKDILMLSEDGKVKFSSLKAMIEDTVIPDDKDKDTIAGSEDEPAAESDVTASLDKPGIEDTIGDEANGGDPSVSTLDGRNGTDTVRDGVDRIKGSTRIARILAHRLDNAANYAQRHGFKKIAYNIDMISNTLNG